MGRIDDLTHEQRLAFAAAVSINFPERVSSSRTLLFDVSGLLDGAQLEHSNRRLKRVRELLADLRNGAYGRIVLIATGPHDHEFYQVDLGELEQSLFMGDRFTRVVRPIAGDIYIGAHPYLHRNPAQWELLTAWRQLGVFTILSAPRQLDFDALVDGGDEASQVIASYAFKIGHFDAVIAAEKDCEQLTQWLEEFGPPRQREIRCSADLLTLVDNYVGRERTSSVEAESSPPERAANWRRVRRLLVEVPEGGDGRSLELLKRNGKD